MVFFTFFNWINLIADTLIFVYFKLLIFIDFILFFAYIELFVTVLLTLLSVSFILIFLDFVFKIYNPLVYSFFYLVDSVFVFFLLLGFSSADNFW